tara:strand:- start:1069 stop:1290 length:222 start_codon:yes stop_codon:yes gene_type:complete
MAKRIGKYKISKKESALTVLDGGTITGTVNMSQSLYTTTTNPAVAGQLFVTSSAVLDLSSITGSADFLLVSRG